MTNAATSTIGNSIDREEMDVQAIGFPPAVDFAAEESLDVSLKNALPVLARVPRLEPEVAPGVETERPTQGEARHYRIDTTLAPPVSSSSHPPVVPLPPQPEAPFQDEIVPLSVESNASADSISSPIANLPPLHTLRQLELSSAEDHISASLLRLQVMLKPLARIILLAALLTASALAYLLLESNGVPQAPPNREVLPSASRPSEPRLTRRPESTHSSAKPSRGPILKPSRTLSALGPGGKHDAGNKSIVANRRAVAAKSTTPVADRTSHSPTVLTNYPNTGKPDVTLLPIAAKAAPVFEPNKRPVAVAKLTGSIQQPIKR